MIHPEDIAWRYLAPFGFAGVVTGLFAFDPARVTVEEYAE